MRVPRRPQHPETEPVELAALADGSLEPRRAARLEADAAGSAELTALLDEQRRAVALVRGAAAEVEAPAGLRARLEAHHRAPRHAPRTRRRLALAGGLAVAVAAVAVVLTLALPGGVGGPAVADAAVLAALPATGAAPGPDAGDPKLLAAAVEGVPFPSWAEKFGWEATGIRTDELGGREVTTVFYEKGGKRIGYSIVAGDALEVPGDAGRARREGVDLRVFAVDGQPVVTWERLGRTCVLTGADVDAGTLVKLAAWRGTGSVPF